MVQVNNTPINLRFKFYKVGNLKYISHLDLVRTMSKVIVRAGLPLWYSEGFNPKPKMVFAAPLSTGTQSRCEFMEIRLKERINPEEAMKRLNENMTDEMQVLAAYYPENKLTDLKWLSYSISIKTAGADKALADKCNQILESDSITVEKKSKSGLKEADIKPLIKSASAVLDGEFIKINCILSADSAQFLNPEYIVKALRKYAGILSDECIINEYYEIMREVAYSENMEIFA